MLQKIRQMAGRKWIEALICLVLGGLLFGSGYWLGQRSILQKMKSVQAANMPMPRAPWSPANGAVPRPMSPGMAGVNIPPNASPEMKEFMQNRVTLMQKLAELRQQNPGAGPNGAPDPKVIMQFQQQNAALFQRQKELSQIIAEQQAKNPPPPPPPLQIPPGASPQLTTYLTARDQLMRDQIAFMNQHRGDDPATRQAAMQQWRQQNASRFQELQQEAQAMSQQNAAGAPTPAPAKKTGT